MDRNDLGALLVAEPPPPSLTDEPTPKLACTAGTGRAPAAGRAPPATHAPGEPATGR